MAPAAIILPRLYVILDAETLAGLELDLLPTALRLQRAGVRLIQYRDKRLDRAAVLGNAILLAKRLAGSGCRLILNDYPDLVRQSGFDGVHVGQDDADLLPARAAIGPERVLGISTHNDAQVESASGSDADYLAIGPVFGTSTKKDAEPVVGLEGVRRARNRTTKPLVAIGGISLANAASVLAAGADAVAVIGALFGRGVRLDETARRFIDVLAS